MNPAGERSVAREKSANATEPIFSRAGRSMRPRNTLAPIRTDSNAVVAMSIVTADLAMRGTFPVMPEYYARRHRCELSHLRPCIELRIERCQRRSPRSHWRLHPETDPQRGDRSQAHCGDV